MNLIDDTKLSDEEIARLPTVAYFLKAFPFSGDKESGHWELPLPIPRQVADAATAKALWECVIYLRAEAKKIPDGPLYENRALRLAARCIEMALEDAGIPRPKEASYAPA